MHASDAQQGSHPDPDSCSLPEQEPSSGSDPALFYRSPKLLTSGLIFRSIRKTVLKEGVLERSNCCLNPNITTLPRRYCQDDAVAFSIWGRNGHESKRRSTLRNTLPLESSTWQPHCVAVRQCLPATRKIAWPRAMSVSADMSPSPANFMADNQTMQFLYNLIAEVVTIGVCSSLEDLAADNAPG